MNELKIETLQSEWIPALVALVNSAYRGDASKKGWTTEADIISGELRTDEKSIQQMLQEPGAVIFICRNDKTLFGTVYLKEEEGGLYLGMLSVSPEAQGLGIGKRLMHSAEVYAKEKHYKDIHMTVINIRHELIAWYERYGYKNTGETKPFHDDARFGVATQPIHFIVLKKMMEQ